MSRRQKTADKKIVPTDILKFAETYERKYCVGSVNIVLTNKTFK